MNSSLKKATLSSLLSLSFIVAKAQEVQTYEPPSGTYGDYLMYALVFGALVVFIFLVINVSDNLLAIEARQSGADRTGANFGVYPRLAEIFRPSLPSYLSNQPLTVLKEGYDMPISGKPSRVIEDATHVTRYAIQPPNFIGVQPIPKMMVEEGQSVQAGDPIFYDKNNAEAQFVAPVSGEVISISRGMKRAITEVVILADKDQRYRTFEVPDLQTANRGELVSFLLQSGAWTMLRQRPYNVMPDPADTPRDIFISTFDSAPLAPDLNLIVEQNPQAFRKGLEVLSRMTTGFVYLGLDGRGEEAPSPVFTQAEGVVKHYFRGPHPSGNVGVHIHHLAPVAGQDKAWAVGVQEVMTIGELFLTGRMNMQRIVALTGDELTNPRYVRTYAGANIAELVQDGVKQDNVRYISGDVLSGQQKAKDQYLNFHDDQLTVIEEGNSAELFGWLLPALGTRPSISPIFPELGDAHVTTNTRGEKRAFVVTNDYETVMPMDIYTQQLMKSILVNDFERMEGLGIRELVEEDVALCEFVCVSKQPLQQILRRGLETMREQG